MKVPEKLTANDLGGGWGSSAAVTKPTPTVSADEDFGGWTSPTTQNNTGKPKPASGFGGNDDLFSNVWE
jgi:stromal membrane-associated protein